MPVEYTRIDTLVGVVFAATKDIEVSAVEVLAEDPIEEVVSHTNIKTPSEVISEIRDRIIEAAAVKFGEPLIKKTRAMYWSPSHEIRVACTISKRYESQGIFKYWYAYHPSWDVFLGEGSSAALVLGCVDLDVAFVLPLDVIRGALKYLNVTEKSEDDRYWHLKSLEPEAGKYFLQVPTPGADIQLMKYQVVISKKH